MALPLFVIPPQFIQTADCHANVSHTLVVTYQVSKGQKWATDLTVNSSQCTLFRGSAGPIDLSNGYDHCSLAVMVQFCLVSLR